MKWEIGSAKCLGAADISWGFCAMRFFVIELVVLDPYSLSAIDQDRAAEADSYQFIVGSDYAFESMF